MDWNKFFNDFADKYYSVPDFTNEEHVYALQNYLIEQGMLIEDVDYAIKTLLFEAPNKPVDDKVKQQAKKLGLVWKRVGYGKEGEKGITHKVKDGKLEPVGDEEPKDDKEKKDKEDDDRPINLAKGGKVDAQLGGDRDAAAMDMMDKDDVGKTIQDEKTHKNVSASKKKYEERRDNLSEKQQNLMDEAFKVMSVLYNEDSSRGKKRRAAKWLVKNLKMSTNANGKKAYFNTLGGNRKIISGTAGTKASEDLVNQVRKYTSLDEFDSKGITTKLSSAAKPDLGKENVILPKNSKVVDNFFRNHPVTSRVRDGLWGVFGVKDVDGSIKMPSSDHSKEYLEQSFNNPALQNTINAASEYVKNGNVDKGVVKALQRHQKRLSRITSKYDIPSDEASEAVGKSYNEMMVGLHESDSEVASAIMKQLAENRLYEEELAKGEEVYLPSNGSFPGGDKIKVDGLERVTLVSVKWGKAGRTYGCPANAKAVTSLHPDEKKRFNQGQYVGEDGHTLLITDDLIKGDSKEETIKKTDDFINSTLGEVALGSVLDENERKTVASTCSDYMDEIDRIKKEVKDTNPADATDYWKRFNVKLKEIEQDYKDKMRDVFDDDKIAALVGENNVVNFKNHTSPDVILGIIEIANNIRTSQGYGLSHNKQYYDKEGNPQSKTDVGTTDPNDYALRPRNKRTAGRAGGGIQLSFTGDGKSADVELTDNGSRVDAKTGKINEI